jgi:hypothetical protein
MASRAIVTSFATSRLSTSAHMQAVAEFIEKLQSTTEGSLALVSTVREIGPNLVCARARVSEPVAKPTELVCLALSFLDLGTLIGVVPR